jgi:nicotinamidase-related amidase
MRDEMDNVCLVLIDLQNDYFPGGNMSLVGIEEAAANAKRMLKRFRELKLPVIHIQHVSTRPGATFFLPDTAGVAINQTIAPRSDEIIIIKNYPNGFRGTSLLEALKKVESKSLVFCGAMTHMCIDATARAAFDLGFACTVSHDACATKDLKFREETVKASQVHAAFLAALSGTYADVLSTEEILGDVL